MPAPLRLDLSPEERSQLEDLRDHAPKPYLRERAAALLKIADGFSGRHVALYGLLKKRRVETVYEWFRRYCQEGLNGLLIRKGRGRKPAFSPSVSRQGGSPSISTPHHPPLPPAIWGGA